MPPKIARMPPAALHVTPAHLLTDSQGRPYFLWDMDMTLAQLRAQLAMPPSAGRDALTAKVLRQAKPDDAVHLIGKAEIVARMDDLGPLLGDTRAFWEFWAARWRQTR